MEAKTQKTLITTGAVVGGGIGVFLIGKYALGLLDFQKKMEIRTSMRVDSLTFQGVKLRATTTIRNPSGQNVEIRYPYVGIFLGQAAVNAKGEAYIQYKANPIGQNLGGSTQILLKRYETTAITPPVEINIDPIRLLTEFPFLIKEAFASGKIFLKIVTETTIDRSIPYTSSEELSLPVTMPGSGVSGLGKIRDYKTSDDTMNSLLY